MIWWLNHIFVKKRKRNKKQLLELTSKKRERLTLASKRPRQRRRRTPRRTLPSPPATPPVRATSCSWIRSAATRTTIRASACPSVATPSRTRWALSPRTSPPPTNRTTNRHADRGRSAWWVYAPFTPPSRCQLFNLICIKNNFYICICDWEIELQDFVWFKYKYKPKFWNIH